jgi:hypothetical protein
VRPTIVEGEYSYGNGLGPIVELHLEPGGTFHWRSRTDIGDLGDVVGRYSVQGDVVALQLSPVGRSRVLLPVEGPYHVIDWGDRVHLVRAGDLANFCDQYNQGNEPRSMALGWFFMRFVPNVAQIAGLPKMPGSWGSKLRQHRGVGRTTEVLEDGRGVISLGKTDGVVVGTDITAYDSQDNPQCRIVVMGARADSSRVRCFDPPGHRLQVGYTVYAPWFRP